MSVASTIDDFVLTVNGVEHHAKSIRGDMLLLDFLHERLGLTGAKYACGIGACSSCKVAVSQALGGPLLPVLACYARLKSVEGMHVTTVEGIGDEHALHPLQAAFLEDYAFQCGYSTPGFLMAGYILLDQLERSRGRERVHVDRLDAAVLDAIGGHICRCTGYVRYFNAIRRVVLKNNVPAGRLLEVGPTPPVEKVPSTVSFQVTKQSSNDLTQQALVGSFPLSAGRVVFVDPIPEWATCRSAFVQVRISAIDTGVSARDLNLQQFFFLPALGVDEIDDSLAFQFELASAREVDPRLTLKSVSWGSPVAVQFSGSLVFGTLAPQPTPSTSGSAETLVPRFLAGAVRVPVQTVVLVRLLSADRMRITSQEPFFLDARDLGLPVLAFATEFGLDLVPVVGVSLDVEVPYYVAATYTH